MHDRREDGVAAVEFAIVAGLLLMLLIGIVEFGMAWNRKQGLEAAAREGARLASVGAGQSAIVDRVRDAQTLFDPADVAVSTSPSTSVPCSGATSEVTVTARVADSEYGVSIPLVGTIDLTFETRGVFRCE